ncbi:MAG: alpha/beta hydrolase, partial [Candidatus Devosia euplotis]|nr:alpha/beta hydrolase [Candidatus Devosia euplotis]
MATSPAPHGYSVGGNAWNADSIIDASLDRSVQALEALRAFPFAGAKLGIYSVSRGAEHALLLASLMAQARLAPVDAIVVHSPPDVICHGFNSASWRDKGDPGWQATDPGHRAWTWHGSSDDLLATTPIAAQTIPSPLFISHGTADRFWSVAMTRRIEQRLL